jgi:hypothetical protein
VPGNPDSLVGVKGLVGIDPRDTIYCVVASAAHNLEASTERNKCGFRQRSYRRFHVTLVDSKPRAD